MDIEVKVVFVLRGGAKQIMYLLKRQVEFVKSIAHDLQAESFKVEYL